MSLDDVQIGLSACYYCELLLECRAIVLRLTHVYLCSRSFPDAGLRLSARTFQPPLGKSRVIDEGGSY